MDSGNANELSFPAEIIDLFIDNLQDDPAGLRVCSLVCKHWMIRTRYRLFHAVQLHIKNLASFLKLFYTPTRSTLLPAIRHLHYTYPDAHTRRHDEDPPRVYLSARGPCAAIRIQSSFTEILARLPPLPAVVSLALTNVTLEPGALGYMGTVFPNLVELTTLRLGFSKFLRFKGDKGKLQWLPGAPLAREKYLEEQRLAATNRPCASESDSPNSVAGHEDSECLFPASAPSAIQVPCQWTPAEGWAHLPSSLQSLTVSSSGDPINDPIVFLFHLWMTAHPRPPALRRVDLHYHSHSELLDALGIVEHFGDGLVEVTVQEQDIPISYWPTEALPSPRPDAYKRLTKLKSLQISSAVIGARDQSWLLAFLAALRYTRLHDLKLGIHGTELADIERNGSLGPGWGALFAVLRLSQFCELRELRFSGTFSRWQRLPQALSPRVIEDIIRRGVEDGLGHRCAVTFGCLEQDG